MRTHKAEGDGMDAGRTAYEPVGQDPDPASVRRVTFVPFLPGGLVGAVRGGDGVVRLPSGEVLPGEDWILDTAARVPLETMRLLPAACAPLRLGPRAAADLRLAGRRPLPG